jgi:hypothetical protein
MSGKNLVLLASLMLAMGACQTVPDPQHHPDAGPANSLSMRPKQDVRVLRTTLTGKSMRDVVRIVGHPRDVSTLEARETWHYEDIARDSITGRAVRSVDIVFLKRKVESVDFIY